MPRNHGPAGAEPSASAGRRRARAPLCCGLILASAMAACSGGNRQTSGSPSAWTPYHPDSPRHVKEFVTLTSHGLGFPSPDSPQVNEPLVGNNYVYVAIYPEGGVVKLDPARPGSPPFGDHSFAKDSGRVMAKLVLVDLTQDFDVFKLENRTRSYEYVIWWLETKGSRDTATWQSRYYKVNVKDSTVVEVTPPSTGPRRFAFYAEGYTPGRTPRLSDWNRHPTAWGDSVPADSVMMMRRYSTWVSCGSGCCSGR